MWVDFDVRGQQTMDFFTVGSVIMDYGQLFGLSFWWHPFTAEDPLVSKWRNDEFLQTVLMKNKLIYSINCQQVFHFGAIYSFRYFPVQFAFTKAQQAMYYVLSSCFQHHSPLEACYWQISVDELFVLGSQSVTFLTCQSSAVCFPPRLDVCDGGYLCVWDDILIAMTLIWGYT